MPKRPRVCDYGDSTYRQDFWEGQGRDYEDAVERRVLKRLLPSSGRRLLEVGAGFGRITDEYHMFQQVVLLDYSLEQLQYARRQFGDSRFLYVAADAYRMPFQPHTFDGATMIRVIHHFENVPAVLDQISQVLANQAVFILEFANKRNLKAILRHLFGRNDWNPFTPEPVEFVELNFNFHPDYLSAAVSRLGFDLRLAVPVSWLRLSLLKRALPSNLLANLDEIFQRSGWKISPSIFLDLQRSNDASDSIAISSDDPIDLFKCPLSGSVLQRDGDAMVSEDGTRWGIKDGVFDFRQPLS